MTVDYTCNAPLDRPCLWPLSWVACSDTDALDSLTEYEREAVEAMAVDYLTSWTQGVFGTCPVVWRPCRQRCFGGPGSMYLPLSFGGRSYAGGCGVCGDSCSCFNTPTLRLVGPVASIDSVTIDGVALDADAYRLYSGNLLSRVDGGAWPTCQDMSAPPGQEGSFVISYQHGNPVPIGGQIAAGLLAVEMAKALCNDTECQLPLQVQQISRQGITISLMRDFNQLMANGQTGIWLVDSWMASVMQPRRPSRVYSPDVARKRYAHPGA